MMPNIKYDVQLLKVTSNVRSNTLIQYNSYCFKIFYYEINKRLKRVKLSLVLQHHQNYAIKKVLYAYMKQKYKICVYNIMWINSYYCWWERLGTK